MSRILLLGVAAIAAVAVIATAGFLAYRSFRQADAAKALAISTPDGINEAMFVRIGGIDQWVQIRGEHRSNPVILVMHGGMAMSYMPFTKAFQPWEKRFTVVQWDRRGGGKTFGRNGARGSGEMSLDRIADDGIELSQFLARHLHKRKIILLGHSMGSQIGVTMAARRPDLFHVYVATEQVVDMADNEAESYRIVGERLLQQGDAKALATFRRIGPPPYPTPMTWGGKQALVEKADPIYGRFMHQDMGSMLMFGPAYSPKDLVDFVMANSFSGSKLYPQWMAFDARKLGTRFGEPVVVIMGEHDVMTPTRLVQAWLDSLQAPRKELVLLKGAGHLSMMTAPAAYLAALETHVRPLAVEDPEL